MSLRALPGGSMPEGRLLRCIKCGINWRVYELPRKFIRPDLFDCGQCGDVHLLNMDEVREQTRRHDPAIAEIPFGDAA